MITAPDQSIWAVNLETLPNNPHTLRIVFNPLAADIYWDNEYQGTIDQTTPTWDPTAFTTVLYQGSKLIDIDLLELQQIPA